MALAELFTPALVVSAIAFIGALICVHVSPDTRERRPRRTLVA